MISPRIYLFVLFAFLGLTMIVTVMDGVSGSPGGGPFLLLERALSFDTIGVGPGTFKVQVPYVDLGAWFELLQLIMLWDYDFFSYPLLQPIRFVLMILSTVIVIGLFELSLRAVRAVGSLIPFT